MPAPFTIRLSYTTLSTFPVSSDPNKLPPPSLPSNDHLLSYFLKKTEALAREFLQCPATHVPCSRICTCIHVSLTRDELSTHLRPALPVPFTHMQRHHSCQFLSFSCSIIFLPQKKKKTFFIPCPTATVPFLCYFSSKISQKRYLYLFFPVFFYSFCLE